MAKISSKCEWCGKSISYESSEVEQSKWWKCNKCGAKLSHIEKNDCYEEIVETLKKGKWVVGKRIIHNILGESEEYVVFVFLTKKGNIRATHAKESIKEALQDLFSNSWSQEDIKDFGFTFLQEMTPTTYEK